MPPVINLPQIELVTVAYVQSSLFWILFHVFCTYTAEMNYILNENSLIIYHKKNYLVF